MNEEKFEGKETLTQENNAPTSLKKKLFFIIGGAVALVAAAIAVLVIVLGGGKDNDNNGNNNAPTCKHDDATKIAAVEAVAPTCQSTGLTAGMKCTLCDTMVVPQVVVEKIDCIEGDWIIDKEATKTEEGKMHTECTMCHKLMEETIPVGSKGLSYSVNGKECTITGKGSCTDTEVVIPSKINGRTVTSIGWHAFYSCSSLTSIVIPDSVDGIGDGAFENCTSLKSVVIPDSVESIGDGAFYGCTSLESIVIPDSVTSIDFEAFRYCSSLTSIVIGDSVTSIGGYAFDGCSSLTDVYYTGSEAEWAEISIYSYNSNLIKATKHFNYVPEE